MALLLAAIIGIYGLNRVSRKHVGEAAVAETSLSPFAAHARGQMAQFQFHDAPRNVTLRAVRDGAGAEVALARWQGRVILVNLWATWCPPCRAEMPELGKLQAALGGADFEVVTINLDRGGPEKPRAFLDEIGVKALSLNRDPTLKLFNVAKAKGLALGLPATFLLDKDGCLIAHMNGPADWAGPDATVVIDALRKG